jgi:hypothetical protein
MKRQHRLAVLFDLLRVGILGRGEPPVKTAGSAVLLAELQSLDGGVFDQVVEDFKIDPVRDIWADLAAFKALLAHSDLHIGCTINKQWISPSLMASICSRWSRIMSVLAACRKKPGLSCMAARVSKLLEPWSSREKGIPGLR